MNKTSAIASLLKNSLALILVATLLAACAPATPTPFSSAKIRVGIQPFIGFAPVFIAQEEGFFAEYGIEAEFVTVTSSAEAIPALVQGDLDLLLIAVNPGFFNAIANSSDVRVALSGSQLKADGCTPSGIVARKADAERLKDVANWKGLTLATSPTGLQGIAGFWVDRALKRGGLTFADLETTRLPPASSSEALQSGSVDMVEMIEPWVTRLVSQADAQVIIAAQEVAPNAQFSVVAFGPKLLKDPELGSRAAAAYLRGVAQYQAGGTDRNAEIVAKYTELPVELLKTICWSHVPVDGQPNLESLVEFQQWAVEQGTLEQVIAPENFWDGRFLEQAQTILNR
jgi:NitT/TauT family transport system substrate-binding protein